MNFIDEEFKIGPIEISKNGNAPNIERIEILIPFYQTVDSKRFLYSLECSFTCKKH